MKCPDRRWNTMCPDPEACQQGWPCEQVRKLAEEKPMEMQGPDKKTFPTEEAQRMQDLLTDWWRDRSEAEIDAVVPKAIEYGPNSMIEVGRAMGRMSGRDLSDQDAIEVACMFYICGKVGRWVDAVAHGKLPSDDTLHDIGVYVKMAQRNRDVGGWPFPPDHKDTPIPGI